LLDIKEFYVTTGGDGGFKNGMQLLHSSSNNSLPSESMAKEPAPPMDSINVSPIKGYNCGRTLTILSESHRFYMSINCGKIELRSSCELSWMMSAVDPTVEKCSASRLYRSSTMSYKTSQKTQDLLEYCP
jgi:hypothetical protein